MFIVKWNKNFHKKYPMNIVLKKQKLFSDELTKLFCFDQSKLLEYFHLSEKDIVAKFMVVQIELEK